MALYKCECGEHQKEIKKISIVYRDNKWITKGSECPCGKYMESEPQEGIPSTLNKN
jgi:predicted SprT family Zn-dependent metalloprotease